MKNDGEKREVSSGWRAWLPVFLQAPGSSGSDGDSGGTRLKPQNPGFWIPRGDAPLLLILGVLVAASYLPALWGEFVWDDSIMRNLVAVSTWGGIWELWFDPVGTYLEGGTWKEGHYWPLLYTTFWLEHKLWGFHPLGYHMVNLLLHFANTALLWRLLLRLGVPGAWFAAAVFAAHPLHTESVAWIISRKDLLSALFYLSAFFMWVRFVESPRIRLYVAALLLFGAALLCKSIAITLPAALLIWQWWKEGRVTAGYFLRAAPFFLVGLVVGGFDIWFYKAHTALSFDYSVYERALIASRALWFYAGKLLWPMDLAVIYPRWEIDVADPLGWGYFAAAVAVASTLWIMRRRIGRGPLACALFFAVTLSPTLGLVDYSYMGHSFVADRFQYLAGIGVIILFAAAATRIADRLAPLAYKVTRGVALAVLILLCVVAWNQTGVYRNELSLFNHVISHNPQSWAAHQNVGMTLLRLGRFEEAEKSLRNSLEIFPLNVKAFRNLGEALKGQQRYEESLKWYGTAVRLEPEEPLNHAGMGTVFFRMERYPEAVSSIKRALELQPDFETAPRLHSLIAQGLRKMGLHGEADRRFELSVKLARKMSPGDPATLFSRAEDLRGRKRHQESLRWYQDAIKIDPDFTLAYAGMGDSLYQLGRYPEAVSSIKRALELEPDLPMAPTLRYLMVRASGGIGPSHSMQDQTNRTMKSGLSDAGRFFSRAEELREQKRYEESLKWYRDTIGADPDFALAYAGMGDSLYRMGRYEEAVSSMKRVFELLPDFPMAPTLHYLTAQALQQIGRYDEAEEHYENVLLAAPNFKEGLSSLGGLMMILERYEDAVNRYRALAEIEPGNAATHSQIGIALLKAGKAEEALASFDRALSLDPTLESARSYREQVLKSMAKGDEQPE